MLSKYISLHIIRIPHLVYYFGEGNLHIWNIFDRLSYVRWFYQLCQSCIKALRDCNYTIYALHLCSKKKVKLKNGKIKRIIHLSKALKSTFCISFFFTQQSLSVPLSLISLNKRWLQPFKRRKQCGFSLFELYFFLILALPRIIIQLFSRTD